MDCSISGVLIFGEMDERRASIIEDKLIDILIRAEERGGRDSWGGIVYLTKKGGEFREEKGVGGPASSSLAGKRGGFLGPDAVAVIANNRAEPPPRWLWRRE